MLRLHTTTGLSALALLIGIAGTGWLSGLTSQWQQPSDHVAMVDRMHATRRKPSTAQRRRGPVKVVQPRRVWRNPALDDDGTAQAAAVAAPASLQPLATPADTSQSWEQLRGHLDGRVVVHVRIDRNGRVDSVSVSTSSGDAVLDQHALRSVRRWRFAVPPGYPDGFSGELPMLFSSHANGLGML
ncbi:MAG: energy transducer TonB [Rhodanobacter sp.]|nr:MAG: energy transducer TonB [Rhodanobacter sp.]TAM01481.1 MAG: energy transducer TonB [Rhodanobacter sp.]TAM38838.1 MAG: energy transducer TonB [Rhodanobacter sp.]